MAVVSNQPPALTIELISLFPEACDQFLHSSIVGRARARGLVRLQLVDPRRWAGGRHRVIDDRPFGGGPGMVLAAPPLARCLDHLASRRPGRLLVTSPQGRRLDQAFVGELAGESCLRILCGHYEGIDERVLECYRPEEFSIGDLVLSGGEAAALVLIDAVTRLLPGALGHAESAASDSFADDGLLDHPCYTRPATFRGRAVPAALLSGDHAAIDDWRHAERQRRTRQRRPDLLDSPERD